MVILVIWKDPYKELRGTANYLILNLAVSDFLIGFPGEFLTGLVYWFSDNRVLVQADSYINYVAFVAASLTIICLAVERQIVITSSPLRADLTPRNRILGFMAIWLLAFTSSVPIIIKRDVVQNYFSRSMAVICISAIIVVFACYMRIYLLVRRQLHFNWTTPKHRLFEGQSLTENSRLVQRMKMKERSVAWTTIILVLLFFVCWIPVSVAEITYALCSTCSRCDELGFLIYLQPLLNPIAYALRTAKFRSAFRRVIQRNTF